MEQKISGATKTLWHEHAGFPQNIWVEVLRDDEGCGARTLLVKIPPEGRLPAHSHRGVVQRYVVAGECEIDGESFTAGAFSLLPRHCDVSPITSTTGATLLLIYDPVSE